jgi:methyl acetate hydrolase
MRNDFVVKLAARRIASVAVCHPDTARSPVPERPLRDAETSQRARVAYETFYGAMSTYQERTGTPSVVTCEHAALMVPIMTDPGARWEYGTSVDFVGLAVEAASGKWLDAYFRDRIFTPLGMNDTAFKISDTMRARLLGMHARAWDGSLTPIPFELEQRPEVSLGGGGLYGIALDYLAFIRR